MNINIGLLGGSFNPIHSAHLMIAEQALKQINLDHILFLPVGNHPLKSNNQMLEFDKRCELISEAIQYNSRFRLSLLDGEKGTKSYTINLIKRLKKECPDDNFIFIGGSDLLYELPKWYRYEWLLANIGFCIFPRPGFILDKDKIPIPLDNITILDMKPVAISSTLIRDNLSKQKSIKNLVPEVIRNKVISYYNI